VARSRISSHLTIVPYCSANIDHATGSIHTRRDTSTSPDQMHQLPRYRGFLTNRNGPDVTTDGPRRVALRVREIDPM